MMTKTKTNAEEHRRREKACTACGTKETVQWRKGARGECLCNACGVRFLRRGRKKEGEGTHQNDHFGNDHHPGSAKRRYREETEEKEKKNTTTTKGKKMKMDDTEWTKEMDEYRASLIAAVMANTAAVPEAESDGGTFRIQDLIENAPNHAAAPEIINSIEKERIQQTYWLNEDEVSEKSV